MAQLSINPCLPSTDPCRSPNYPLFSTGISVRQVPLCDGPTCDCEQPSIGRYRITAAGTLDRTYWLEGWIISQLITRGEVSCEEHPLRKRDGGWWADAFRQPAGFRSGSKLWSLQWALVTNEALIMAKQYATQALQYLVTWGIASRIAIETTYVSQKVMRLHVTVTGPGLQQSVTIEGQGVPAGGWVWERGG
jgi:phage gp46-like protein